VAREGSSFSFDNWDMHKTVEMKMTTNITFGTKMSQSLNCFGWKLLDGTFN